jgi:hypothetical protein
MILIGFGFLSTNKKSIDIFSLIKENGGVTTNSNRSMIGGARPKSISDA